ncbi:cytochrome C oxidase subunit IV family protein [Novosphingobium colocasiae]|uniref:Uncharacterized protein n=1 Tax=Novosphingobium colocasiae TaxID=1256513 RepID=A0A918P7Y6_9SPHN|nr:cytochrome C oxidase subunit IV family protein [Novosphingobium colocasiae]GGY90541.1 hypothetical protein GCM10011614_01520 [Novosphingobium colocasiae]
MVEPLRPVLCWAILIAMTLGSVAAAELLNSRQMIFAMIFGVAVLKGQLVAVNFMEVGRALPVWNTLYRAWIVVIGGVLLLAHLFW